MPSPSSIAENIAAIHQRMAQAAARVGREPTDITLMAVTKTVEPARIRQAYDAGLRVFGENRVQEFEKKSAALKDCGDADWHLIGHLQSNKAADAARTFAAIDSVDSLRLAQKLNAAVEKLNKVVPVLLEINIGEENSKSGLAAESHELDEIMRAAPQLQNLTIRGLMTIPPFTEDPKQARPYFRQLRDLSKKIAARQLPAAKMEILSMGMSHDFEVAIEEGSTCVRIGAAIFGARPRL